MFMIDVGASRIHGLYDDNYAVFYFNGAVPETYEDFPFLQEDVEYLTNHPSFCGLRCFGSEAFDSGYFANYGGIRFMPDLGTTTNVPFGHIGTEEVDSEIFYSRFPINWEYEGVSVESLKGSTKRFSTQGWDKYNPLSAFGNYTANSSNYWTFSIDGATGDSYTLTFADKFVLDQLFTRSYNQDTRHKIALDVQAWDYDTEAWVSVAQVDSQLSTYTKATVEVLSDKYKLICTDKPSLEMILSSIRMFSLTPPGAELDSIPQPTWLAIMNITNLGKVSKLPFMWGSCSGPTGNGEFRVHTDQLKPLDNLTLLTNEIQYNPMWRNKV